MNLKLLFNYFCISLFNGCWSLQANGKSNQEFFAPTAKNANYDEKQFSRCTQDEFECQTRPGDCIPRALLCDEYEDCVDGSDETNCCDYHQFRCLNGECLNTTKWCDGYFNCKDLSDEVVNCQPKQGKFKLCEINSCPNNEICLVEANVEYCKKTKFSAIYSNSSIDLSICQTTVGSSDIWQKLDCFLTQLVMIIRFAFIMNKY